MALYKIKEFYPDYRDQFGDQDIIGYDLYSGDEKIGSVDDLLVDDDGKFRYLVVGTGVWIFGKRVLLPIGRARMDYSNRRVYADGLTREQVENLPEFTNETIDYDQEEQVRGVYRPTATTVGTTTGTTGVAGVTPGMTSVDATPPVEASRPITDRSDQMVDRPVGTPVYDRDNYRYDYDPDLYDMSEQNHQHLRLYEERLVANKTRQRTGEVRVGKHVETETAHVSVPVERERVVIERSTPTDARVTDAAGIDAFNEGEVARVEVYEETPDIRKETYVREEVDVRKEVDRDTIERDEQIRRERLDVDSEGNPVVRDSNNPLDPRR
jgi:uncharacterized protein (TIGR02271 family)